MFDTSENSIKGPIYTGRQHQNCDNADATEQFGVGTHF